MSDKEGVKQTIEHLQAVESNRGSGELDEGL
jgi:hypothetical protein